MTPVFDRFWTERSQGDPFSRDSAYDEHMRLSQPFAGLLPGRAPCRAIRSSVLNLARGRERLFDAMQKDDEEDGVDKLGNRVRP